MLAVPIEVALIVVRWRFHCQPDQRRADQIFSTAWTAFIGLLAAGYVQHGQYAQPANFAQHGGMEAATLTPRGLVLHGVAAVWVSCVLQIFSSSLTGRLTIAASVLGTIYLTPHSKSFAPLTHEDRLMLWSVAMGTGATLATSGGW